MPITVKDPNGRDVQFPDGTSQEEMVAAMAKAFPPPSSTAEDVAKGAGVGLAKGVLSIPEIPGNAEAMGRAGINAVADKLLIGKWREGVDPKPANPLSGGAAQRFVEENVTGPFYKPQTGPGKFAEKVGEYAPGMLVPGGGPLARAGMNVLAPAVGDEIGERLAPEGYEGAGRVAGALVGPMAVRTGARAVTPLPSFDPERNRLSGVLDQEGVRQTAGQRTDSTPLQYAESVYGQYPFAGQRSKDITRGQGMDFTEAVLRRVGLPNARRATSDVIDNAFDQLGGHFQRITGGNHLPVDPQLGNALTGIANDYNAVVAQSQRAPIIADVINDITNAGAAGGMTGAAYQDLRSRLGRLSRSTQDTTLARAVGGIREALDDAFERGLTARGPQGAQLAAEWTAIRGQYRDLLVVEDAAKRAGAEAGILSPAQVRAAIVAQNERDYVRGGGNYNDLARAGAEILKPLPNSGTPARLAVADVPAGLATGAGFALGGLPGAAAGATARTLGPAVAGRTIMNPYVQSYLGNQIMTPVIPALRAPRSKTAAALAGLDDFQEQ